MRALSSWLVLLSKFSNFASMFKEKYLKSVKLAFIFTMFLSVAYADPEKRLDPISHMDQVIKYSIQKIPELLDEAVHVSEKGSKFVISKRLSQGWSIVVGSWYDIASDYIANNRSFGNLEMTVWYKWGFIASYGIGFGYPLLLGLPDDTKDCGSKDFLEVLEDLELDRGLTYLFERGATEGVLRSLITEFEIVTRHTLSCIDSTENIESMRANTALSNFVAAMNVRVEAESARKRDAT